MTYKNRLLEKLNMPNRSKEAGEGVDSSITEMMMDPRYLRQSSSLVNQALQKGFDVLQMEDGEIVMTGTKTIIYRYQWDAEEGMLMKKAIESKEEDDRLTLPEVETVQ
ncbi:MAG: DUF2671 domain-containing protein [Rickettsiales bacterium]|nr:DUF2671 domain-containing protein [Rickettsiales bacterium]